MGDCLRGEKNKGKTGRQEVEGQSGGSQWGRRERRECGQSLILGCGLPAAVLAASVSVSGTWNYGSHPATNVTHKGPRQQRHRSHGVISVGPEKNFSATVKRFGRCLFLSCLWFSGLSLTSK